MAKTFTYDKRQRNRQPPPQRSTWNRPDTTTKRGAYADIADRVRDHRHALLTTQKKNYAADMSKAQKRPASD